MRKENRLLGTSTFFSVSSYSGYKGRPASTREGSTRLTTL